MFDVKISVKVDLFVTTRQKSVSNYLVTMVEETENLRLVFQSCGSRGGLMVSALVTGSSGPGSSPGRGHCVVFLGKTLYSHSASLHPGV